MKINDKEQKKITLFTDSDKLHSFSSVIKLIQGVNKTASIKLQHHCHPVRQANRRYSNNATFTVTWCTFSLTMLIVIVAVFQSNPHSSRCPPVSPGD